MVKLPATVCPFCKADMRTGERPEEKTPIWKRRGFKTLTVICVILLPVSVWIYQNDDIGLDNIGQLADKIMIGLHSCAEPREKMWESDDKLEDQASVKQGYASWKNQKKSRPRGQGQYADENLNKEQREVRTDKRAYFADTLMTEAPSKNINPGNNWYRSLPGEWDVAWITRQGAAENITTGEWIFSWVNSGEALEDVLNIPYLWEKQDAKNIVRVTTLRTYNGKDGVWEGARVFPGRILPFRAGRNQDGSIYETFLNAQGNQEYWVFTNMTSDAFQVYVSESPDNGQTYRYLAEIWAKIRTISPS
jgi:hypothetical protein